MDAMALLIMELVVGGLIILFGLFGNIMTIMCYNLIKSHSCRVIRFYIQMLTTCDTVVLLFGLFRKLIGVYSGQDIGALSGIACKLLNSIGYFASHLSVWMLVAASWERFTAIAFPLKNHDKLAEKIIVVVIITAFVVIDGHHLITDNVVYESASNNSMENASAQEAQATCRYENDYADLETVWPIIDVILYSLAPFVIIGVLNCLIIYHARNARHALEGLDGGEAVRLRLPVGNKPFFSSRVRSSRQTNNSDGHSAKQSSVYTHLKQMEREYRLTRMLLILSFSFILLTSPNAMLIVVSRFAYAPSESTSPEEEVAEFAFVAALKISEMLMYLQHAIQFYLYCVLSVTFRVHVRTIFGRCRQTERGATSQFCTSNNRTASVRASEHMTTRALALKLDIYTHSSREIIESVGNYAQRKITQNL